MKRFLFFDSTPQRESMLTADIATRSRRETKTVGLLLVYCATLLSAGLCLSLCVRTLTARFDCDNEGCESN